MLSQSVGATVARTRDGDRHSAGRVAIFGPAALQREPPVP